MKRRVAVAVVLLLAAGAGIFFYRRRNTEKPLVFSGTIEARDVEVGSLTGGRVVRVVAAEGSTVRKGDPIVTLETDLIDLQLRQQEARVAQSRRPSQRITNGIDVACW